MALRTVGICGMIKMSLAPAAGIMTVRALPGIVISRKIPGVARSTILRIRSCVIKRGRFPALRVMAG